MRDLNPSVGREQAETLALQALAHLAADEEALGDFLTLTGLSLSELRSRAASPQLLAGVLDYLLSDERQLLAFCQSAGIRPEFPARARRSLPGADKDGWT